jgi:hypothetical protein
VLPSEGKDAVTPLQIDKLFNATQDATLPGVDLSTLKTGRVRSGEMVFDLKASDKKPRLNSVIVATEGENSIPLTKEIKGITVNEDVNSLIFLHACAAPANNEKAYRKIYNFDDTADLLGWYEIVYEDGFIISVPVRYGYNILEWNVMRNDNFKAWYDRGQGSSNGRYCYRADAVDCSGSMDSEPVTFFAFEWQNARPGKKIKEINLKGTSDYISGTDKVINQNGIILIALSIVKTRNIPETQPQPLNKTGD